MHTIYLFGGMTVFVSVILYSVITKVFCRQKRRGRPFTRRRRTWLESSVAMIVSAFLLTWEMIVLAILLIRIKILDPVMDMIEDAFHDIKYMAIDVSDLARDVTTSVSAFLHAAVPRTSDVREDITDSPRALTATGSQKREAQPWTAPRTPRQPLHPTKVSSRARLSRPASLSSSGSSTIVGTPSRGQFTANEHNNSAASCCPTQVEELQELLASSTTPGAQRSVRTILSVWYEINIVS
jgi:hypothetical protein